MNPSAEQGGAGADSAPGSPSHGTALGRRLMWMTVLGNLAGALLTFVYFNFLDPFAVRGGPNVGNGLWVFFVVSFALLFSVGRGFSSRWSRPVIALPGAIPAGAGGDELRRRALFLPAFFALVSCAGWIVAALIWGVFLPLSVGEFTVQRALRQVLGMSLVAGPVVAASVFFSVERVWRGELPRLFPLGNLSATAAPRLRVRTRMVAVFLLMSLVPAGVLSVAAVSRAYALFGVDAATAETIIRNLILVVAVIAAVTLTVAVRLAGFVAGSVAEPLREVQAAMAEVERGVLDTHCAVVSNDEIEAVFGAPVPDSGHAEAAVRAALEMRSRLQAWNAKRTVAGKMPLRHGIGIHTGTVIAGNIGSAERLSYALVGDAVNLTSRIQSLNKEFGTHILLSGATRERIASTYPLKPLSAVRVKGRVAEVEVFSLE